MQSHFRTVGLLLALAALFSPTLRAQELAPAASPVTIRAASLRAQASLEAARHEADALSVEHLRERLDVPATFETAHGVFALVRAENGRPVYVQTLAGVASPVFLPTVPATGTTYTGQGVQVGVWDGGIPRRTHQELSGHLNVVDQMAAVQAHATHVAGIIGGSGVDAQARGLAPDAGLVAYDWGRDRMEMIAAATNGLRLSNHSYGQVYGWVFNPRGDGRWAWLGDPSVDAQQDTRFGQYDWLSSAWDGIAYDAPYYLMVKAAGNDRGEGPAPGTEHWIIDPVASQWVLSTAVRDRDGGADGFDTILDAGNAKNVLTVGALGGGLTLSNSAWGPTNDGRIKPDVTAHGSQVYSATSDSDQSYAVLSGTSMAAATATGTAAQLLQVEAHRAPTQPLRASTYRAVLVHTAAEAGNAPGPDYAYGWGMLDAAAATAMLEAGLTGASQALVQEMSVAVGGEATQRVYANGTQPLRVTIAWTDPKASSGAIATLVNDLDVTVVDDSGTQYLPWVLDPAQPSAPAQRGLNTRDNVEQVVVDVPAAGFYTIQVRFREQRSAPTAAAGKPQTFSLVASGLSVPAPTLPVELTAFEAVAGGHQALLRWTTASETNNAGFSIELRPADEAAWRAAGWVAGNGTTVEAQRYQYSMPGLAPGRYHFRLRQVDFDGAFAYSPEVELDIALDAAFAVSTPAPNPFAHRSVSHVTVGRGQQVQADVYDLLGRHVATAFSGYVPAQTAQAVEVDGEGLAPGVYVLVVQGEAFRHTERIVRVR